jgi:hypothetical protein
MTATAMWDGWRALDEAPARGWHVVSMRDDWSRIFP